MKQFSIFYGGSSQTKPNGSVDITEVIRLIKEDEPIKKIIDKVREEKDPTKKSELKNGLPYITVSGKFTYRNNESLIDKSYTWCAAIDIDKKGNEKVDFKELYEIVKADPFVTIAFISPSGNGIKAIIQLEENSYVLKDQYNVFRDSVYPHFENKWKCELDPAQGKISQPFFLTHDPNIHINREAKILKLDTSVVSAKTIMSGSSSTPIKDLEPFINGIINQSKNKWEYFNRVAIFVGGLCSGKIIKLKHETVIAALVDAAKLNKEVKDIKVAQDQIIQGFNYGLQTPIDKNHLTRKTEIKKIMYRLKMMSLTSQQFIRVGDDYYKKITRVNMRNEKEPYLKTIKRNTIVDDFGIDYLEKIPSYDVFCNVPSYKNHQYVIDKNYNLFHPFKYKKKEGKFDTVMILLNHIFGKQIEMGLDYMQLLYQNPAQLLPVLCLVSKENHTGKTTYIDFLARVFKGNTAIISTADIEGNFNQHFAMKQIIAIDESDLHKERTTAKIKQMATQKSVFRKGKFQDEYEVDYFGKLVILSNNETSFINIKDEDVRYWIRKIAPIEIFDPNFEDKLYSEIPAFINYIDSREMECKSKQSRAYFDDKSYQTEWLDMAKIENKSSLQWELKEKIMSYFGEMALPKPFILATAGEIQEHILGGDKQYNIKWISKCLRDEFKIESKTSRSISEFSKSNDKKVGTYFVISKSELQIDIYEDVDNEEDTLPF